MKRLLAIGLGSRIRWMLGQIDAFGTDATLVAAVDPNQVWISEKYPELVEGVTFYEDVDTALDQAEPDGVLIGTTCNFHTEYAIKVMQRNLPLFLEKPVSITEEQLQSLYQASTQTSAQAVVSFPLRLSMMCHMAKDIIDSGVIGTVENVQAINNVPFYGSNYYHGWMRNDALTGGLWLQKATHDLDYLTFLMGQVPQRVVAVESKNVFTGDMPADLHCTDCEFYHTCPESQYNLFYMQGILDDLKNPEAYWESRWKCSFAVDTGNHDSATAILQYASGAHMTYTQNFYTRRGAKKRGATLVGYKGTVTFDWYTDEVIVHHHQRPKVERHRIEATGGGHHGGDMELAHDFLAILNGTGDSRATLHDGLISAQLCMMAKRSCHENGFVTYTPLANS